jgi:predicted HTH domain antitoxin
MRMTGKTIKVQVDMPEGVSDESKQAAEQKAHEAAVLTLWEAGELSTREAAAELSLPYHEFLDLLNERGIPVESGMFDAEALEKAKRHLAERPS